MKTNLLYICSFLLLFTSCEKDLEVYSHPDNMLNFYFEKYGEETTDVTDEMRTSSYSFIYAGEEVVTDTLWFKVTTMGFVSNEDRPLELVQVKVDANDAVADVHYRSFDNADLKARHYYIPAGAVETMIPVVMLRDASLKEKDVMLKFTFVDNGVFKPGYTDLSTRSILISDRLSKPSNWSDYYLDYIFGIYGPVKHQFMIDVTGKKWDNAYIEELANGDQAYISYLADLLTQKLAEENYYRSLEGLEPLCEEDGTSITFSYY